MDNQFAIVKPLWNTQTRGAATTASLDMRLLTSTLERQRAATNLDLRQRRANNDGLMTPEARAHVAALVTAARQQAPSRSAFARTLGITRATLRAWERGAQTPTEEHLEKLAELLAISVATLKGEAPLQPDDERLRDLTDEDLAIAQQFHHAPATVKYAIHELLTAPITPALAQRIAHLVDLAVRHLDGLVENLEDFAFNYDAAHRALPETRPIGRLTRAPQKAKTRR